MVSGRGGASPPWPREGRRCARAASVGALEPLVLSLGASFHPVRGEACLLIELAGHAVSSNWLGSARLGSARFGLARLNLLNLLYWLIWLGSWLPSFYDDFIRILKNLPVS